MYCLLVDSNRHVDVDSNPEVEKYSQEGAATISFIASAIPFPSFDASHSILFVVSSAFAPSEV